MPGLFRSPGTWAGTQKGRTTLRQRITADVQPLGSYRPVLGLSPEQSSVCERGGQSILQGPDRQRD